MEFIDIGYAEQILNEKEMSALKTLIDTKFEVIDVDFFCDVINEEEFFENEGFYPGDIYDQDPDATFYKGMLGSQEVYGITHSGMNQIFTENGENLKTEYLKLVSPQQDLNDPLSWVLLPYQSTKTHKYMGKEISCEEFYGATKITGEKAIRYQYLLDGEPVCGMHIHDNVIENIFTHPDHRKQGYTKKLTDIVMIDWPLLQHSDVQTDLGKKYSTRSRLRGNKK